MSFEIIAGLVVVILGAIAGAFGIGHARGTSKAEAKADQQHTEGDRRRYRRSGRT